MKSRQYYGYLILATGILTLVIFQTSRHSLLARANIPGDFVREGTLTIVWGDPGQLQADADERIHYYLGEDDGRTSRLFIDEDVAAAVDLLRLNGRRVRVTIQPGLDSSRDDPPILRVADIRPLGEGRAATLSGNQPIVTILCKFSDKSAGFKSLDFYTDMAADVYPGLSHFWGEEQSYGIIDLMGSAASGPHTLPNPRSYYVPGSVANLNALVDDCTAVADPDVDFSLYAGINMVFNDALDCCAWGGRRFMTLDGVAKVWGTAWLPPWAAGNISVVAHELGHTFGLPHSSAQYGETYDSPWDVMSYNYYNCPPFQHPVYSCVPQGTISYHRDMLGWIPAERKYIHTGGVKTIALEQLSGPQNDGYLMAHIPVSGSATHFYTVEVRRLAGYDAKLPGAGVIIHEVKTNRTNRAQVVDTDMNGNAGDAGAIWTPGETFYGPGHILVSIDEETDTGYTVTIATQPPSNWYGGHIGQDVVGLLEYELGYMVVGATGGEISGSADRIYYAWQPTSGSMELLSRVPAWDTGGSDTARAGLMIRGSLDADAPYYMVNLAGPDNTLSLMWRATPGEPPTNLDVPTSISLPVWLKVSRTGANYAAFYSSNGAQWTQIDAPRTLLAIPNEALYGIAVASGDDDKTARMSFDLLSTAQWTSAAIGASAQGDTEKAGDRITLQAAAGDIYGLADSFYYHHVPGKGALDMRVKLGAWDANTIPTAAAGLMVRASDAAGAPEFSVLVTGPNRALKLKYRPSLNGPTSIIDGPAAPSAVWLRLVRDESTVSAYYSADGVAWMLIAEPKTLMDLDQGYLYGLAVTSSHNDKYVTASFDELKIGPLPVAPVVTPTPTKTPIPSVTPSETPTATATAPTATAPIMTTTPPTPTATTAATSTPTATATQPPSEYLIAIFLPVLVK